MAAAPTQGVTNDEYLGHNVSVLRRCFGNEIPIILIALLR